MIEKNANKPEKKGVKIVKAILNTIINILIVVMLIVSILVAVLALTSKANENGLPNIFGYTLQYVESPSMDQPSPDGYEGGPFTENDCIIGRVYSAEEFPQLRLGDIITYNSQMENEEGAPMLITHRIVKVEQTADGTFTYQTWGDDREVSTVPDQENPEDYLTNSDIVAVFYADEYHGTILTGWAGFMRTLRSQGGFFGFILIPMIIFFMYAMIRVVLNATDYRKTKVKELKEEAEKEKKEAVDAAVKAALEAKEAQNAAPESAPPADMTEEQLEQFKQFLAFQKMQNAEAQTAQEAEPDAPAAEAEEE